ncbi:ABC transporter substrate-binding protein [Arthrobacter sp. UM1]|uniref:ABC transporter substrate-binding protein n=1 Tax=Arthrobacter sp. UM1 TaxID=2766776 RepID=UPI001CF62D94|nr:ABC transporter substrate-binding protein [Arthrobacter sp. UM1]MCB4208416.1 ABC transporter substrate-binding protein [Arthrobacter sp. UM1]
MADRTQRESIPRGHAPTQAASFDDDDARTAPASRRASRRRPGLARAAAVVGVAALALTACAPPQSSNGNPAEDGKAVTVWLQQKPDKASPLLAGTYGNSEVINAVHDKLVNVTPEGRLEPRVAKSWQLSQDARTLTIRLNDQKWSDGTRMTADDVVFTLNLYANKDVKSPLASVLKPIKGSAAVKDGKAKTLSGVSKTDDRTVKIELEKPDVGFMYTLFSQTFYVLPKHALEKEDPATVATSKIWVTPGKVPGLGAFTLSSFSPGQRAEFNRNPHFRTPVKFPKLVQTLVTQDAATQELASGELDVTLLQPIDVDTAAQWKDKGVETVQANSPGFDRYSINQRKPYLKDKRVRQGLITAVDRQGIIDSVYAGRATPINSSFTSATVKKDGFKDYAYNPQKAKQLLKDAGFDFSREFVIREVNNNAQRRSVDQVVLRNLRDIGVNAVIKPVDQAQVGSILSEGDYDLFLYGGGNYSADPSTNIPMITCDAAMPKGSNLPAYCNPKVDELLAAAAGETDRAKRAQMLTEAGRLENDDVSHLWIARPTRDYAYSSALTGGVRGGDGMPDLLLSAQDWQTK